MRSTSSTTARRSASSNPIVALYPTFQAYFPTAKPPLLAVWGRHDPFLLSAGAEAFRRDDPNTEVHFSALDTHAAEIAVAIRDLLDRTAA